MCSMIRVFKLRCLALINCFCLLLLAYCSSSHSLLFKGVHSDNLQIVSDCLSNAQCRGTINLQDESGNTALHISAFSGATQIVEKLLAAGADLNLRNSSGQTPLMRSIAPYKKNTVVFEILLKSGAYGDVNGRYSDGSSFFMQTILKADSTVINRFVDKSPDLSICDSTGKNALFYAAMRGDSAIFCKILKLYPKWNDLRDNIGNTLLHYIANTGSLGCAAILIGQGAEVNARNKKNENALFNAVYRKRIDLVSYLIDNGCYMGIKNDEGIYPFEKIFRNYKVATIQDTQKILFEVLFKKGFVLPDSIIEPSVRARVYYLYAQNFALNGNNMAYAEKFFNLAKKEYYSESKIAMHMADSLDKELNKEETNSLSSNIAGSVVAAGMTGASYSTAVSMHNPTFTMYRWIPKETSQNLPSSIAYLRSYAKECYEMGGKCSVDRK
jgi:ankyrin repeat protein